MVDFEKMYNGSYYTIVGCGGDLEEWKNGYNEFLSDAEISMVKMDDFVTFKGEEINNYYNLVGSNRFDNDLTFLAFPLDGLNIGKLAMFKLRMGDRWFDDIVDNSI